VESARVARIWKVRMIVLVERKVCANGIDRELSKVENVFSYT